MAMSASIRVGIVGGSLGGLNAALWLRAAGCDVTIYERAAHAQTGYGGAIVLNPATLRWFSEHGGLLDVEANCAATHAVRYVDFRGDVLAERADGYRFAAYDDLSRALRSAFGPERYRVGRTVVKSGQTPTVATATFDDATTAHLDLLVCADGAASHYRASQIAYAPELAPVYAGYVAWRGVVRSEDVSTATFNRLFNAITCHVMPRSHMLVHPLPAARNIPGTGDTQRSLPHLNWVWYRNVSADELRVLLTDRAGKQHMHAIGPGIVRDEHVLALWEDAGEHLPPLLAELVTKTAQPDAQAVVECEPIRMAHSRVCTIGDAAFIARPHTAAAGAKACDDGYQLAQALQAHAFDVRAALKAWEANQLALGRSVVARARDVGDRLQQVSGWEIGAELPYGLYRSGDSIWP
jgi:2,6-dihydroxypyridine 3-monooxygenase